MDKELARKIVGLETALGLLQHDFDKQNEMIVLDSRRIEKLEKEVRQLSDRIESYRASGDSRPIPDERPPHY